MANIIFGFLKKFFVTSNERKIRSFHPIIKQINDLSNHFSNLSTEQLKKQTFILKDKLLHNNQSLDEILPEAFATVREVSTRVLGLRHFDVQLLGGIALHKGMIAEMGTGEGKTLVATLPAYLNALTGQGVHIVTVNDYLASRDASWMGEIFNFLELSVGCITHNLNDAERKRAYNCDITYGTNNELGFDYLRDNMKYSLDEMTHRKFNYAIVDEVDSILIDEARTPLIISGPSEEDISLYTKINTLIFLLEESDYEIDEKTRNITFTEIGNNHLETILKNHHFIKDHSNLYDEKNVTFVHHALQSLKAHKIFKKDVDYLIQDGKVMIIDEFSGRVLTGRRYSDGLHQAIEAKEQLKIHNENQTLASITFQNYFRLYPKLAGMTGTAFTESAEFLSIYNLEVLQIPTHKPIALKNEDDEIYLTAEEKNTAIINEIKSFHALGQPILIGTVSIEKSELLSALLSKQNIQHLVLNAKHHEQEAHIIAQAGRFGAVTIATNMAGRGTDIALGGNPQMLLEKECKKNNISSNDYEILKQEIFKDTEENRSKVLAVGGLYVIGTERHESRRIDNQLGGRAGRQGAPGKTKFYLSLQDDLMRIFAPEKIISFFTKMGVKKDEKLTHPWINNAVEKAQTKVEGHNFEVRKNILKYDDVVNEQRKIIYEQRSHIIASYDISEMLMEIINSLLDEILVKYIPSNSSSDNWDNDGLHTIILTIFGLDLPITEWLEEQTITSEELKSKIFIKIKLILSMKENKYGTQLMRYAEKQIFLLTLDTLWKDHLLSLDALRNGIGLRAYGQKNPLIEFQQEALALFAQLLTALNEAFIIRIMRVEFEDSSEGVESLMNARAIDLNKSQFSHNDDSNLNIKIGRNEICNCGSGKKYKHCHGKL